MSCATCRPVWASQLDEFSLNMFCKVEKHLHDSTVVRIVLFLFRYFLRKLDALVWVMLCETVLT